MEQVRVPFSHDQVLSLNAYQIIAVAHEFTCPREHAGPRGPQPLVAERDGWHCRGMLPSGEQCDYLQEWAHDWMADFSWQDMDLGAANAAAWGEIASETARPADEAGTAREGEAKEELRQPVAAE